MHGFWRALLRLSAEALRFVTRSVALQSAEKQSAPSLLGDGASSKAFADRGWRRGRVDARLSSIWARTRRAIEQLHLASYASMRPGAPASSMART
mmetsp:Transcript_22950/g.53032  ORF Transcript_22950/g.53032 Transcript_22950/m.53032 type:complete len:95 (-) Transcript_22950:631-915(-)